MWSSVVTIALTAAVTVVAADLALQRIEPVAPEQTNVEDGVAELTRPGPDILVFGSSHTRSFHPLQQTLRERAGHERVAVFTMESGWALSFEWVFQHRVAPLLDEKRPDGTRVRDALSRVVVVMTMSDVCGVNDHTNIPRNGWRLGDFLADVADNGLNDYNRSYLPPRAQLFVPWSLLARRGLNVLQGLKNSVRDEAGRAEAYLDDVANVRGRYVNALDHCPAPDEMAAMDRILDDLTARGLEVTAVMFPLPPVILEEPGDPMLAGYRAVMHDLARRHPEVRLLDWATSSPLHDADFMADLDHANHEGNIKLMDWALQHDLAALLDPVARHGATP